jgi:tRNA(Ile)-lysidine synthase
MTGDIMITKVKKYMEKYHMVNSCDKVIVGLSGGADSVCLLFLLKSLSGQMNFALEAVHVNHQLREEADEEEAFVKNLCCQWGIPCQTFRIDVKQYADSHHLCIEEAARSLRYQIFEKAAGENDVHTKIALAHHQNDQAETVLFHLFRGSGIRGMAGIRPVREHYIRPFLCIDRSEIEQFAAKNQLQYVTDASNLDTTYSRNKIRHDILPMAEKEVCQGSIQHIVQSAELMGEAVDLLDELVQETYQKLVTEKEQSCRICKMELKAQHPYLQSAIIYEMLARTSGRRRDISKVHVDSVLALLEGQSGRQITLIYGIQAVLQQQDLVIMQKQEITETQEAISLEIPGTVCVNFGDGNSKKTVECRVFAHENNQSILSQAYTKWFDYDKIKCCPILRYRQQGDYFYYSDTGKKKLKEYFINEKVPLLERDRILLIAEGNHILWIPGYRMSSYYKVTEDTTQILEIKIYGGEKDER